MLRWEEINLKVNIQAKLDKNKLDRAIREYKYSVPYSDATYLIMNTDTQNSLRTETVLDGICCKVCECGTIALYKGINIAICESLAFGEVEIN